MATCLRNPALDERELHGYDIGKMLIHIRRLSSLCARFFNQGRGGFVALAVLMAVGRANGETAPRIYRDGIQPHWFAYEGGQTNLFWYRLDLPAGRHEFILVNAKTGTRREAFDQARVARELSKIIARKFDGGHLPVQWLQFAPDGTSVQLFGLKGSWLLDLRSHGLSREPASEPREAILSATLIPHPTRFTGDETRITFVNHLRRSLKIFWIGPDNERKSYGILEPGDNRVQQTYAGHVWLLADFAGNVAAVFQAEAGPHLAIVDSADTMAQGPSPSGNKFPPTISPNGRWAISLRGDNLFLTDLKTGTGKQLTYDGNPNDTYKSDSDFDQGVELGSGVRSEREPAPEIHWSPDSRYAVAMRLRPGTLRRVYEVQSSPPDQLQPKLISFPYLKPGDQVPISKPHLFDVERGREIPISDALFANPWSITDVRWEPDSRRFTFLFNQRGHQALRILAVDARSGAVRPIVNEESKTFIDYSGKYFCYYLNGTHEIIWMSERDGWNHLYLYDSVSGRVKDRITCGRWVVRHVDYVDERKRQIWFQAGGIVPGQNPYYIQECRVNFDGSGLTILTHGNGTHTVQFSPDRRYIIDTWSRVDLPPVIDLRSGDDGRFICHLEKADAREWLRAGGLEPEPFAAKGRDGITDIYGVIWHPKSFDPHQQYPVIESIYAGPQDSYTPESFHASYPEQELADDGFIVVKMDGMGTSNRSKKFQDVCWKNLKDAGFPDRILWIKAAAAKHRYMDLTRVGIYGTSAGGQDALRGVLDHGDFYKVCVADSGCYDNRMDKIWWNEQWMGWPVDASYARSSCVLDAHKLHGKLMLMVGELDHNVDPSSTMQVVNALVQADKDFDLVYMPNTGHGVAETPYGWKRLQEFFVENLLKNNNESETGPKSIHER